MSVELEFFALKSILLLCHNLIDLCTHCCMSLLYIYLVIHSNNQMLHFHFSFSSIYKENGPFRSPEQNSTLLKWQVHWDICTLSTLFTGMLKIFLSAKCKVCLSS